MKHDIYVLVDYRGAFYSTIRNKWGLCSYDLEEVRSAFLECGLVAHVMPFSSIDFRRINFNGCLVVYQSSEDNDSQYKDYLEDVLLGIHLQGGILIPPFQCFRAHHNKLFMEILRDLSQRNALLNIRAKGIGTLEDLSDWSGDLPVVLKSAWGAGSREVYKARSFSEMGRIAKRISRSRSIRHDLKEVYRRIVRKRRSYVPHSFYRRKFIVQEFIPGLVGDYKVLVFWDRFYLVQRENRPRDFRASGSGRISWPATPPTSVLNCAKEVFDCFDVPFISIDIALADDKPVVIEFQFVSFGPLAAENSSWHFLLGSSGWERVTSTTTPEREFVRSISQYLSAKQNIHTI